MTDTWAEKVLEGVPRHNAQDAKNMTGYTSAVWLHEDAVVDALAKLGAGDGLVAQATAALEGVTDGPWIVDGEDQGAAWGMAWSVCKADNILNVKCDGVDTEENARFIAFARQWVPEAADRIAALTAQNRELALDVLASSGQAQDAYAAQLAAEAERDALRAKVARLEGALRHYRETLCEGFCGEDMWADEGHSHPEIQRDCGGCLAASVLLSAALTDGAADE